MLWKGREVGGETIKSMDISHRVVGFSRQHRLSVGDMHIQAASLNIRSFTTSHRALSRTK